MNQPPVRISLIAAVAQNLALGKNNQLLWHLPNDLQFFKRTTLNHPIIMGRKTYDSIGRPLPKRLNIVISRQFDLLIEGCVVVPSLRAAIALASHVEHQPEGVAPEVFVIGGAQIYAEALPMAARLVLTEVKQNFEADVFFPQWDKNDWQEVWRESHYDEASGLGYDFVDYHRR
ncbi:dihydrofolate reductase [Hydromonas duriensis]|uniref:Dihydrofolate reductase n=1 Tax=Hydromonas duriensis TaxID=1527608 RepID=A0A4R6YC15_9BURK|nr:dihydrofolate reductase [Hydromonas duriensis]TDR33193.1 dihydrofolate reductase [Hydromonas duriensis]